MNQKIFFSAALIVLAVLVLGAAGYFAFVKEPSEMKEGTNDAVTGVSGADNGGNPEGEVQVISYSGEWIPARFPGNYNHSVNFFYPATWEFTCCGDTDARSTHTIRPAASFSGQGTGQLIAIHDFALFECPGGEYANCAIGDPREASPEEFLTMLVRHLDSSGEAVGLSSLARTGTVRLANFTADVPVYRGVSTSGAQADLYLVQSAGGVVGIEFDQPQRFDPAFTAEFLNNLAPN